MSNSKIKVIGIDLIDTLFVRGDLRVVENLCEFIRRYDVDIAPDILYRKYRKRYIEYSFGNYISDYEFFTILFCNYPSVHVGEVCDFFDSTLKIEFTLFDGSYNFLETLSGQYKLILASNFVSEWGSKLLISNGIDKFFYDEIYSSSIKVRKPSSLFFEELIRRSGCQPRNILMIGDSIENDIFGASQVSIKSILINHQNSPNNININLIISSLEEFNIIL